MNQWITSRQFRLLWCAEKEKLGLLTLLSGFSFHDQKVSVDYKRERMCAKSNSRSSRAARPEEELPKYKR